jgi:endonuclease/exonuclease/phosphatase family metal-dependent hydrolase
MQVQEFAAFRWAEPAAEVLDWAVRQPRLLTELRQCRADVICLQEVPAHNGQIHIDSLPPRCNSKNKTDDSSSQHGCRD